MTFPSLRKQDLNKRKCRNGKGTQTFSKYPSGQHNWIKWANLFRMEFSFDKMSVSPKELEQKSKTWIWIQTWIGTEIAKTDEDAEEKMNTGICWDEKTRTKRRTNQKMQLEEINQKISAKEGKLEKYFDNVKQWKQNMDNQNNEGK